MSNYIAGLINELEENRNESQMKEIENARFTITLGLSEMRRLEYFCKYFEVKRATFAVDLIMGALNEIEDNFKLTIDQFVNNQGPLNEMQKEYFQDVLRLGSSDTHVYADGKLIITDKNGNKLKTDFTEEDGEDNE